MESNIGMQERERGNSKGVTSLVVATNVRAIRTARGLDLAGFSDRLAEIGWSIPVAALSRLENGNRRIDVDDLTALSHALGVSPVALLSPSKHMPEHPPLATTLPLDFGIPEAVAWFRGDLSDFTPASRLKVWQKVLNTRTEHAKQFEAITQQAQNAQFDDEAQLSQLLADAQNGQYSATADVEEAKRFIARLTQLLEEAANGQ